MTPKVRVFLDASVLLAAAGSPGGGSSAAIALLTESEAYQAVVSAEILREALGNLRLKFGQSAVIRFFTLLGGLQPSLAESGAAFPVGTSDLPDSVAAKDLHVLQACLAVGASVCLTLDRRHLLTEGIRRWGMGQQLRFLSPGEFLAWERLRLEN